MENRNKPAEEPQKAEKAGEASRMNPFEDGLSAEQDIAAQQDELDREQQFKEAQTERD